MDTHNIDNFLGEVSVTFAQWNKITEPCPNFVLSLNINIAGLMQKSG